MISLTIETMLAAMSVIWAGCASDIRESASAFSTPKAAGSTGWTDISTTRASTIQD